MTPLFRGCGLAIDGRLRPTTMTARAGERIALIGPNGGGKTSLLRAIAGVEGAIGAVSIDGELLPDRGARRSRLIGFMRASREIGWSIPVKDVLPLGAPIGEVRFGELVEAFELESLLDRPITELSTGERARVLMARAIAGSPRLLLLDEPLSNLDPYWVLRFLEQIDLQAAAGACIFCALHDLALLDRFDRAILIAGGEVAADDRASALVSSSALIEAFRVEPIGPGRWAIRLREDPRSSP